MAHTLWNIFVIFLCFRFAVGVWVDGFNDGDKLLYTLLLAYLAIMQVSEILERRVEYWTDRRDNARSRDNGPY